MMTVDLLSKDKEIGGNLLESSNSSCLEKGTNFKEITTVVNELKDRKKTAYKEYIYDYLCKERSILLSEAVFNNYVTKLIANGNIIKRSYAEKKTLILPSNSTADSSNNDLTLDK